ncbi:hypothetical protein CS006_09110 [Bifidobacterium primatium]|uniref:Uncharacterized protein n=1 Tax=Bifidobacterium primatium TaxID=2045438 RepID=A0A2M9H7B6_9BIFI|nr:hypothetical protein CS006_09110 [Bifidobacterium primatium]
MTLEGEEASWPVWRLYATAWSEIWGGVIVLCHALRQGMAGWKDFGLHDDAMWQAMQKSIGSVFRAMRSWQAAPKTSKIEFAAAS